MQVGSD